MAEGIFFLLATLPALRWLDLRLDGNVVMVDPRLLMYAPRILPVERDRSLGSNRLQRVHIDVAGCALQGMQWNVIGTLPNVEVATRRDIRRDVSPECTPMVSVCLRYTRMLSTFTECNAGDALLLSINHLQRCARLHTVCLDLSGNRLSRPGRALGCCSGSDG